MRCIFSILSGVVVALLILGFGAHYILMSDAPYEVAPVSEALPVEAQAYKAASFVELPAGWQWYSFAPEPGVELGTGAFNGADTKAIVVLVPGFKMPLDMMSPVVSGLADAGFEVRAIEYRGQGKSYRPLENPEKAFAENYAILASDLLAFAKSVREPGKPLFFFSVSMGGHITLKMAQLHGDPADAYALIVPMVKIESTEIDYSTVRRMATAFKAFGYQHNFIPGDGIWTRDALNFADSRRCNRNPDTDQMVDALFALDPELLVGGATVGWVAHTLKSSDELMSPGALDAIQSPVLMLNSGQDLIVQQPVAAALCAGLRDCTEHIYMEARHCLLQEWPDVRDNAVARVVAFFDGQMVQGEGAEK